jgi:sec-independent protein translocase protein TatA
MNYHTILAGLGWQEIILILVAVLILFGGAQLPKLARNLGKGVAEFKKGLRNMEDEMNKEDTPPTTPPQDDKKDTN